MVSLWEQDRLGASESGQLGTSFILSPGLTETMPKIKEK